MHWLRDLADDARMPDLLAGLTYSVFGLGNSSYERYNAAAKTVDKSLHAVGATRLMKIHLVGRCRLTASNPRFLT